MAATNSVAPRTGNVSAGTYIFAMLVLEKPLSKVYGEIDLATTPTGAPVAMAHCNTCTADLDAWARLFGEVAAALGRKVEKPFLYDTLYAKALEGDADCGGLLNVNYYSGEPATGFAEGRPLFVRAPEAKLTLANFMRVQLYSAVAALKIGMDVLFKEENVRLETLQGHGGLFKTKFVGQSLMASALGVPVAVTPAAGEGGAWGIALLAAFRALKAEGETLESFLAEKVFKNVRAEICPPNPDDAKGFEAFMTRYKAGLAIERAAVESL
jgi:sugar (pentulose or hexulose) kinase